MFNTIVWFAGAGAFSACCANRLRGYHMLRKPHIVALMTGGFAFLGYKMHQLEENYDSMVMSAYKKNPLNAYIPRQELLTYQEMIRKKQGGQLLVEDAEDFEEEDDDDDDEDDE